VELTRPVILFLWAIVGVRACSYGCPRQKAEDISQNLYFNNEFSYKAFIIKKSGGSILKKSVLRNIFTFSVHRSIWW
jgi:hypothetical protein